MPFKIVEEDTYSTVKRVLEEGKTTCSLCSRLRRGILYRTAKELGCTKIALGHHRDDIIATLFLNMFYGGKLKAMPPKLVSDNGEHIVIRPLAYVKEKDLIKYAELKEFPIIPCNLCGSQPNLQRQVIGDMLKDWDRRFLVVLRVCFRHCKMLCHLIWRIRSCLILRDCNAVKISNMAAIWRLIAKPFRLRLRAMMTMTRQPKSSLHAKSSIFWVTNQKVVVGNNFSD